MRKRIVLIACASQKLSRRAKAEDLYTSPLFRLNLNYAKKLRPDDIFILSAKHGLLPLHRKINPYEKPLNTMRTAEIKAWADKVLGQLEQICPVNETAFIFLAGEKYRRYLLPHLRNTKIPLAGLTIGKQLQKLKKLCDE